MLFGRALADNLDVLLTGESPEDSLRLLFRERFRSMCRSRSERTNASDPSDEESSLEWTIIVPRKGRCRLLSRARTITMLFLLYNTKKVAPVSVGDLVVYKSCLSTVVDARMSSQPTMATVVEPPPSPQQSASMARFSATERHVDVVLIL